MSLLDIRNLTHYYDDRCLFDKASLSVSGGEHIGVVGLNGAGKSTFIGILAGTVVQDDGEVLINGKINKGYLDQQASVDGSKTAEQYLNEAFAELYEKNARMEELYMKMADAEPKEMDRMIIKAERLMEELTIAGFFELDSTIKKAAAGLGITRLDCPVSQFSGGQRAKLMLAKLLLTAPELMLLDEPTNFLDTVHIDWLCDYLNDFKGAFLVISHDTDFLDRVARQIVEIRGGQIRRYSGNYSKYVLEAEQNARQYEDSYIRQQREIERMEDYINKNKARAATAGMANARKKQLKRMEVLAAPVTVTSAKFQFIYEPLHTKELVTAEGLTIGYGGQPLLDPIDFCLASDEKIWIRGVNGVGKSTLIKTLLGKLTPIRGAYSFHPFKKIGYIEQDLDFGVVKQNAAQWLSSQFPELDIKKVRAALAASGISGELAVKPLSELSGGERVRVKLTALCQQKTNILILDEPTNHLDTLAKAALLEALENYDGAIILVSHERDFASKACSRELHLRGE